MADPVNADGTDGAGRAAGPRRRRRAAPDRITLRYPALVAIDGTLGIGAALMRTAGRAAAIVIGALGRALGI